MCLRFMFVILLALSTAVAGPIIDFSRGAVPGAGTISFAGGTAPLIGAGIPVDFVTGTDTPLHAGETARPIQGGVLSFTTGAFLGMSGTRYLFDAGGTILIVGSVDYGSGFGASKNLLQGTGVRAEFDPSTSSGWLSIPQGSDTKDAELLAYFGFAATQPFNFTAMLQGGSLTFGEGTPSPFSAGPVTSVDVQNATSPEPGPWFLIGGGLMLLAFGRRYFGR